MLSVEMKRLYMCTVTSNRYFF